MGSRRYQFRKEMWEQCIGKEQWPNQASEGPPGLIMFPKAPMVAERALLQLRADGEAPVSAIEWLPPCNGLLALRINPFQPSPLGITCTLAAFFSLLASDPVSMGVASDPIVGLNQPMGFRKLSMLLHRNSAAPAGALTLARVLCISGWEILRRKLFAGQGYRLRLGSLNVTLILH